MDELRVASQMLAPAASQAAGAEPERRGGSEFGELVTQLLERANGEQLRAESEARKLAAGQGDVVDTMIAVSRADLGLRMLVSLRNRALEAYQELMRLQV